MKNLYIGRSISKKKTHGQKDSLILDQEINKKEKSLIKDTIVRLFSIKF
jgi:hypothetical protein